MLIYLFLMINALAKYQFYFKKMVKLNFRSIFSETNPGQKSRLSLALCFTFRSSNLFMK